MGIPSWQSDSFLTIQAWCSRVSAEELSSSLQHVLHGLQHSGLQHRNPYFGAITLGFSCSLGLHRSNYGMSLQSKLQSRSSLPPAFYSQSKKKEKRTCNRCYSKMQSAGSVAHGLQITCPPERFDLRGTSPRRDDEISRLHNDPSSFSLVIIWAELWQKIHELHAGENSRFMLTEQVQRFSCRSL